MVPIGLARSRPAMSGALPWIGSYIPTGPPAPTRLPTLAGRLEGDLGDADDLRRRVDLGVDAPLAVGCFLDALGLAEVDAAGQLADDQEVCADDDLRLQRGGVRQHGVQLRGAQVRVQ